MRDIRERFEEKIAFEPMSGCWIWCSAVSTGGYGRFNVRRKQYQAHRFSYELYRGPIGEGLVIDHLCRNILCVNPDHLRQCTSRENTLAPGSLATAAKNAAKTHCRRCGSVLTTVGRRPGRKCVPCLNRAQNEKRLLDLEAYRRYHREWRAKRKAKRLEEQCTS